MLAIDTATCLTKAGTSIERIHAGLATTSPEQTSLAIAAVAQCLHVSAGAASVGRLAEWLDGNLQQALFATPEGLASSTQSDGPSLVMAVAALLPRGFPAHACLAVRVVLAEICRQAGPEPTRAIVSEMPDRLRKPWPASVWRSAGVAHAA